MAACKDKEIESVWTYDKETAEALLADFDNIAKIPRQTASCKDISDYMLSRFEALGLYTEKDAYGNIIVTVPATEGMEKKPLTIIQTNMDMVCAPQPAEGTKASILDAEGNLLDDEDDPTLASVYDPLTDGIGTIYNDGMLKGIETALGGKSGMAMTILLKYLSEDSSHGPLRLILTVDAYDSFLGANSLDAKYLEDASYLINLDAGSSSCVYTSSPCESTLIVQKDDLGEKDPSYKCCVALRACGLVGGSAADNLRLGRLNAALILIELLQKLREENISFELSSLYGGRGTDNIIDDATAILVLNEDDLDDIWAIVAKEVDKYKTDYDQSESAFELTMTKTNMVSSVMTKEALARVLDYAKQCEYGVLSDTLIANLGSVLISPGRVAFRNLYVGTNAEEFASALEKAQALADSAGYPSELVSRAEIWSAKDNNKLSKIVEKQYKNLEGTEIKESSSNIGLEPSVFAKKNPNLDIVSIGPDVWASGTIEEFCNVESAVKILNLLQGILPEIK